MEDGDAAKKEKMTTGGQGFTLFFERPASL
jgi:hypothetical protein